MPDEVKEALERLAEAAKDLTPQQREQLVAFAEGAAMMAGKKKEA